MEVCSDRELLEALRAGESSAGAVLFTRYASTSRALARRYGAGSATPDIVQEVWTQILRSPPLLRSETLGGWLTVTIRNRVRRHQAFLDRLRTLGSSLLARATTPTQQLARRELVDKLWLAYAAGQLTDDELEIAALRHETTSARAGQKLGIPASTFRSRAQRVIQKMRAIVSSDE